MSDTLSVSNALSRGSLLDKIANPTLVNPLAAQSSAAQAAEQVWRVRQQQANQASGEAYQGAIDAQGNFDPVKFRQNLVEKGPGAALAAQSGVESAQRLAGEQILQGDAARKVINNELGTVMTLPDDQLGQGITAAAARLRAAHIPEGIIHQTLLNMPNDPAGQRQYLNQLRLQLAGPEQVQQNIPGYGTTGTVTGQGGKLTGYTISPTGVVNSPPQPGAQLGLTPAEKVQTQPAVGPGGVPGTVPIGSKYNDDATLKPPGWGRNNGGYVAPGSQTAQTPEGFTPTGQAPGAAEAQRQSALDATAAGKKIYTDADAATTMKSQLLTMESDLARISTGPTSERAATANAFLQKYHLPSTMTAEEIASSEGFAKIAKQIALAQAGALGAGTDEKLTTSMGANPNRDLSKLGNQQILAMLQGNADAIKARGAAYDQWKQTHPGSDTNSFLTDFNKTFDPRVYQWGYQIKGMSPAQRAAAYDALPDKAEFRRKYNAAVAAKLIDPNAY